MIGASPMDVAKFLQTESRLDPTMVGEFLGENETFVIILDILKYLVKDKMLNFLFSFQKTNMKISLFFINVGKI